MSIVRIGTNTFVECDTPLAIDDHPAFHVTTDEHGSLQLSVEIKAPPAKRALKVHANKTSSEGADIVVMADGVQILVEGQMVAMARHTDRAIQVDLDLRPLGLSVYTSATALYVGKGRFSGNRIVNAKRGIVLSTGEK